MDSVPGEHKIVILAGYIDDGAARKSLLSVTVITVLALLSYLYIVLFASSPPYNVLGN